MSSNKFSNKNQNKNNKQGNHQRKQSNAQTAAQPTVVTKQSQKEESKNVEDLEREMLQSLQAKSQQAKQQSQAPQQKKSQAEQKFDMLFGMTSGNAQQQQQQQPKIQPKSAQQTQAKTQAPDSTTKQQNQPKTTQNNQQQSIKVVKQSDTSTPSSQVQSTAKQTNVTQQKAQVTVTKDPAIVKSSEQGKVNQPQDKPQEKKEETKKQQSVSAVDVEEIEQPSVIAYTAEELKKRFKLEENINFGLFAEDRMDFIDIFSSSSQEPEFIKSNDDKDTKDYSQIQVQPQSSNNRGDKQGGGHSKGGQNKGADFAKKQNRGDNYPEKKEYDQSRPDFGNRSKKDQQTQQAQQQKRVFASDNSDIQLQALEYDSNDEQPEWSEFDPKINTGKFFGREMKDASEIRNKAQIIRKDKGLKKVEDEEDEFDRIMKEKKQKELEQLQKQEEQNLNNPSQERNLQTLPKFGQMKPTAQQQSLQGMSLEDSDDDDIFGSVMKQVEAATQQNGVNNQASQQNQRNYFNQVQVQVQASQKNQDGGFGMSKISQQVMMQAQNKKSFEQIQREQEEERKRKEHEIEQQRILEEERIKEEQRVQEELQKEIQALKKKQKLQQEALDLVARQTTKVQNVAQENLENLFTSYQVVTNEKHRVKLSEISQFSEEESQNVELFSLMIGSINPFGQYFLKRLQDGKDQEESREQEESKAEKAGEDWIIEDQYMQAKARLAANKDQQEVDESKLYRSTDRMYMIYKFSNDPMMRVKSKTYTNNEFTPIVKLFPERNLLETSIPSIYQNQLFMQKVQQKYFELSEQEKIAPSYIKLPSKFDFGTSEEEEKLRLAVVDFIKQSREKAHQKLLMQRQQNKRPNQNMGMQAMPQAMWRQ